VLDAPVARKVQDRLFAEHGGIEIARVKQKLVLFGSGFDDDLVCGFQFRR
jgi:hypothetical protein